MWMVLLMEIASAKARCSTMCHAKNFRGVETIARRCRSAGGFRCAAPARVCNYASLVSPSASIITGCRLVIPDPSGAGGEQCNIM
jgi:hypothetical protein